MTGDEAATRIHARLFIREAGFHDNPMPPLRDPIPLSFEERVALETLRLLVASGRLEELHPPPA